MMKKILIVEDEVSLIQVLAEKLEDKGFTVIKAANGHEGLESALNNHPDLILLDIVMPVMDGMTMLEKLRLDEWGKRAKVILLTNLSDPAKVTKSRGEGVYNYMIKSDWRLDDIVEKINKELSVSV